MSKSEWLEIVWIVEEVMPAWMYRIKLSTIDFEVSWYKSWKMKKNNINILEWDYVKLEINEYDNTKWRITYRYKSKPAIDENGMPVA